MSSAMFTKSITTRTPVEKKNVFAYDEYRDMEGAGTPVVFIDLFYRLICQVCQSSLLAAENYAES